MLSQGSMSISKVTQELLKTIFAVGFPVSWIGLIFPLFELSSTVGAHKTLWMKLVPHGGADSSLNHLVADKAFIFGRRII